MKDALAALERGDPGDDQKAMLRLLAQREEGYGDIGALMGLSDGEVRSKVEGSLAELDAGGEPPSPPRSQPRAAKPHRRSPAPPPARPQAKPAPAKSLPQNKRLLALVGGCVAIVLVLVLFASGVIDSAAATTATPASSETTPTAVEPDRELESPDPGGPQAASTAATPKGGRSSAALKKTGPARRRGERARSRSAKGSPTRSRSSASPRRTVPLAATKVGEDGDDQRPVPDPGRQCSPARQRPSTRWKSRSSANAN